MPPDPLHLGLCPPALEPLKPRDAQLSDPWPESRDVNGACKLGSGTHRHSMYTFFSLNTVITGYR